MKKLVIIMIIFTLISSITPAYADSLSLLAPSSILIDYDTGEVLYDNNSSMKTYPASTTKMMTAILAVENGNFSDVVTVDDEIVSLTKGSHVALEPGEQLTLEQLMYAMMLPSANDAALAIAKHIGGTLDNFIRMMNEKARVIGALDTNFVNPNGLHKDDHYSSAHDMALIGRYAMQYDVIREIVNTVTYEIPPTNKKTEARYLKITNKLLFSTEKLNIDGKLVDAKYDGASGIKTGYTPEAMNCLVSYAERGGQRLIAAVMMADGNGNYCDTHTLLDYGFENFQNRHIAFANEYIDNVTVENGELPYVAGILDREIIYPVSNDTYALIQREITLEENLTAPVEKGQILGKVDYLLNGKVIAGGNIISTANIAADPMLKLSNRLISKWYYFVFGLMILMRLYVIQKRKFRRKYVRSARTFTSIRP
ncbi:MAG: D-alanyl-D-alanine carboxypeptidase family protein [Gudongella sp.]|jgi:D-alanyl-D-alanine carboxypeptidase (penicillin-binding protein 5/6)|nr:D-alanyl-D-alanine carboxypeptidase family protein [Gudongella sp.]